MKIKFSDLEFDVLKKLSQNIHTFSTPEEQIILDKLNEIKEEEEIEIELDRKEMHIILSWSDVSWGIYTIEEESVIKKLRKALGEKN